MEITATPIPGVFSVATVPIGDARGDFCRVFCDQELSSVLRHRIVRQANISSTCDRGTVRGLHLQLPPHGELKLVRCIRGQVWDVVLDLRAGSPTFLHWYSERLSRKHANMLVIPEGCAHGFQVLDDGSELLYLHTASYEQSSETGVRFDDPAIGITWPLPVTDISLRDSLLPLLAYDFRGISL